VGSGGRWLSDDQNIEKREGSELIPISDMMKLACEGSSLEKMKIWKFMLVVVVGVEQEK
jgi:hypothetical protein